MSLPISGHMQGSLGILPKEGSGENTWRTSVTKTMAQTQPGLLSPADHLLRQGLEHSP